MELTRASRMRNRNEQHEEYEKSGGTLDLVYDAVGSLYSSHAGGGGVTGSLRRLEDGLQHDVSQCPIRQ
jgi:hypothetical protein